MALVNLSFFCPPAIKLHFTCVTIICVCPLSPLPYCKIFKSLDSNLPSSHNIWHTVEVNKHLFNQITLCCTSFGLLAGNNRSFCYVGRILVKHPIFPHLDRCSTSSGPEAGNSCYFLLPALRNYTAGRDLGPESWGPVAEANQVAWTRSSGSQFPSHSLWVGPGCLRKLTGAWWANPGWPNASASLPRQPPSQQSAGSCSGHCLSLFKL